MNLIGVGIDLVDIARIERMLKRKGERVTEKLLTARERAYCEQLHHPARGIAARVAAKEATYKALQNLPDARAVGWQDQEVLRHSDGRPMMKLYGLAEKLAERYGPFEIQLSISHSDTVAGAVAVILTRE